VHEPGAAGDSGLHYEQPLASGAQHAVAAQVEEMLKQFREVEQKQLGYSTLAIPTC